MHSTKSVPFKRCFETHPALKVGGFEVFGGSCSSPIHDDADVYVGLDMSATITQQSYPWEAGESFLYYIQDMGGPKNPESFIKMINWLSEQIKAGKKIHVGCIGGHGRTGMVLSALVAVMDKNPDCIQYVRDNYCEKAVESIAQIKFLGQHFGANPVEPSKQHYSAPKSKGYLHALDDGLYRDTKDDYPQDPVKGYGAVGITKIEKPRGNYDSRPNKKSHLCVWDRANIVIDKLS